jgi:alpha-L-arabinofuranosidase
MRPFPEWDWGLKEGCNMKTRLIFALILTCVVVKPDWIRAEMNIISVHYDREIGAVNKKVFGNNVRGRDPQNALHNPKVDPVTDHGLGVWNPVVKQPVRKLIDLAKEAGVSIVRYAMGIHWDWKNGVGINRKHFLFGIDEFLRVAESMDAEAVITVSPIIGNEHDASDLVEYLNSSCDGRNQNGGVDWAEERAKNGHAAAYNVKYFEIGNEMYRRRYSGMSADEYVDVYLRYYEAMKKVDPSIMIGATIPLDPGHYWNRKGKVVSRIKNSLDFVILHMYLNPIWYGGEDLHSDEDAFKVILSVPLLRTDVEIKRFLRFLKQETGRDIPLAVTEYNSWPPYHERLGGALVNAELLKIFMKPENNIVMANHWLLSNAMFGMIKSSTEGTNREENKKIQYIRHPNYYVYELYNRYFGDILLYAEVRSKTYDIGGYKFYVKKLAKYNFSVSNTHIPYLSVNASKSKSGDKVYLMVINKSMEEAMKSLVQIQDFKSEKFADVWTLNGPSISAENGRIPNNVKIMHDTINFDESRFDFTFEPHSLTALVIEKRK